MELVTGFNVRNLLEHGHQFRQIKELGKSRSCPIPCTFGGKLNGGGGFAKGRCPTVKVRQLFLLESAVLQVAHDRIQLRHAVGHRRSGRKHHAAPTGNLIQVAAFSEHIAGFLRFAGR